jgi:hypothetical protein
VLAVKVTYGSNNLMLPVGSLKRHVIPPKQVCDATGLWPSIESCTYVSIRTSSGNELLIRRKIRTFKSLVKQWFGALRFQTEVCELTTDLSLDTFQRPKMR